MLPFLSPLEMSSDSSLSELLAAYLSSMSLSNDVNFSAPKYFFNPNSIKPKEKIESNQSENSSESNEIIIANNANESEPKKNVKETENMKVVRAWLQRKVRVEIKDGRIFIGKLICFDNYFNLLLVESNEYRRVKSTKSIAQKIGSSIVSSGTGDHVHKQLESDMAKKISIGKGLDFLRFNFYLFACPVVALISLPHLPTPYPSPHSTTQNKTNKYIYEQRTRDIWE